MSEEFIDITKWAPVVGEWEFSNGHCVYRSPDETLAQPQLPYGIAVSNVRFSEGTARTTIRFAPVGAGVPSNTVVAAGGVPPAAGTVGAMVTGEARLLFGYRSPTDPYLAIGLGGHGRAYTVYYYDSTIGWQLKAFAGSQRNLTGNQPYILSIRVTGQRILLEVDSVQVLEHVLDTPFPQGQFGLFAWGRARIDFTETSVKDEQGTVFVLMQFSDPYHDLYRDVITSVSKEYNLRAYHAGEVFGPGVILNDIVKGIVDAKIVIAEVTERNPNVYYELGYAHALRKPTILIAERGKPPPFDISGYRHLFYDNSIGGKSRIESDLRKHIEAILRE